MPAGLAGMPDSQSDEAGYGRYHSYLVTTTAAKPAARGAFDVVDGARPPPGITPAFDRGFPDVPAFDPHRRLSRGLSGPVLDLSVDAEQGADALYRAWQFQLPVVTRRFLDGGPAVGDLCVDRRVLQSADRADHRASDQ